MEKKYKLTDETIEVNNLTLYRIEAIRDFGNVKAGDKGGYVENEGNLSHYGDCWVYDNAAVFDLAQVFGNALVYDDARVYDDAWVCGSAQVRGYAWVFDDAKVYGSAMVGGSAKVYGEAQIVGNAKVAGITDYIVFKNWWSSGRYFTWTRSNNMWSVGCFHGTGDELIKKAYADSELSGREYERVVKYVNEILESMLK